ncbi:hypothetical protein H310_03351 [Aphanomyces invadans]|uniref:Cyclic nucleotide-binding domain-containing protein n=1 Tax=Aphanomyces invadans TaxID=157072 RepID=A0A024UHD9_9STRA|nr:hypothetical protein H310_03351 [Aphanomyces invadans]ETW05615.1 hypothetical protein H310_03351 [Aphanomyces invadans]|eukprot:XP_008865392.1 hypothetical protein H310_03351 [Aphanomyces invadans]
MASIGQPPPHTPSATTSDQSDQHAKVHPAPGGLERLPTKSELTDAAVDGGGLRPASLSIPQPIETPPLLPQPSGSIRSGRGLIPVGHQGSSSFLKSIMVKGFAQAGSSGHVRGAFTSMRESMSRKRESIGRHQPLEADNPFSMPPTLVRKPSSNEKHEGSIRRHIVRMSTMRNAVSHALVGGDSSSSNLKSQNEGNHSSRRLPLRRPSHGVVRQESFPYAHKGPVVVPDAPDRVDIAAAAKSSATRTSTTARAVVLPQIVGHNMDSAAKSFMISSKLKRKAQLIRKARRETWHNKQLEVQGILQRHKKVLQQYNIRTVKAEEVDEITPVLVGWSQRLLILPTYGWYKVWQLMTLVIVLHQSVYIPYSLSFEASNDTPATGTPLTNFVMIVFCLDMMFNFNTAIADTENPDILITNRWTIAKAYLKGWFLLDLLACLPIDLIVDLVLRNKSEGSTSSSSFTNNLNIFALLKVVRLPRLFRLARFVRILRLLRIPPELKRWLLYSRYAHLIRVVQLIVSFLYCTHILNCVWNSLNPEWVDDVFPESIVTNTYVLGFYYTLTTLMGQSVPLRTEMEYTFSCLVVVVGALLMAMVFGNVSDLISNFNESPNNYRKKMEQLLSSMNLMRLPLDLQNRINEYYQVMWERHGTLDGQPLMFTNELSKNLAVEVELFVRMDMINRVPVFQKCSKKVVQDLVMNLELQVYLPGDYIVVKGEVGMDMYFVQNGECEVTKPSTTGFGNDEILKKLTQGDYFGEIALLMNCKRTANVRAVTFAELCVLSRTVFEQITDKYAEDREKIETFITEMYDPKVLDAIMKQQALDNPEKSFHARMSKQVADIIDFMEDSAARMERLELMMETLLGLSNPSHLASSASQHAMQRELTESTSSLMSTTSQRRRSSFETNKDMRKTIQEVSTVLEDQERLHNKDTTS